MEKMNTTATEEKECIEMMDIIALVRKGKKTSSKHGFQQAIIFFSILILML